MQITEYSLLIILGCGIVTWIPRVFPFILVRRLPISDFILRFLSYVPLCILTALLVQNLLIAKEGELPTMNYPYFLASISTIIVAVLTKNLMWIVLMGVVSMALIRLYLGVF